jgi:hypothetical protein
MPTKDQKKNRSTSKLDAEERQTLIIPALGTFDTRFNVEHIVYHPVPSTYKLMGNAPVWRIMLKFGGADQKVVVGLDIYGDTVFGRGADEVESPDIDLTNLGALERGVSRRHALLRPTPNKLYLIDLESTNGTFVNAIQVSRGMAQTVRNHDGVAFAGLTCVAEIVSSPAQSSTAPEVDPNAEAGSTLKVGKPKTGRETVVGVKLEMPPGLDDKGEKK